MRTHCLTRTRTPNINLPPSPCIFTGAPIEGIMTPDRIAELEAMEADYLAKLRSAHGYVEQLQAGVQAIQSLLRIEREQMHRVNALASAQRALDPEALSFAIASGVLGAMTSAAASASRDTRSATLRQPRVGSSDVVVTGQPRGEVASGDGAIDAERNFFRYVERHLVCMPRIFTATEFVDSLERHLGCDLSDRRATISAYLRRLVDSDALIVVTQGAGQRPTTYSRVNRARVGRSDVIAANSVDKKGLA